MKVIEKGVYLFQINGINSNPEVKIYPFADEDDFDRYILIEFMPAGNNVRLSTGRIALFCLGYIHKYVTYNVILILIKNVQLVFKI